VGIEFPAEAIAATRTNYDKVIEKTGTPCTLIRSTKTPVDKLMSEYTETTTEIPTHISIKWPNNMKKLEDGGAFTNDSKPILAYVKFADKVQQHDRIKIETGAAPYQSPDSVVHVFEITDIMMEDDSPLRCPVTLTPIKQVSISDG